MSNRWKPIQEMANEVIKGQTSAVDNVKTALKAINDNKSYNAIISTVDERALARAEEIDSGIKSGKFKGKLAGVPFVAKDNFLTFGIETTAASNMLKGFVAPYQSTAIERLESEGAICVAKANLDAFALGSTTENSDLMVTKNPNDKSRVPGGSSGGSAAAVMLDMVPFALGTDTGGSIRLPAAFCGAVGLKPTYGLVSRSGVVAMASSTDVVGPFTRSVEDAALVLDIISGKDALDSTTIDRDKKPYTELDTDIAGKRFAVIKEYISDGIEPRVKDKVLAVVESLKSAGVKVEEVSLPSLPLALASYYIIMPAEVSSNLSRYDGQRYGYSYEDAKNLEESISLSRSKGFGDEVKRRIMIGTYVLSSGYYDAYYKKAQQLRSKLIDEFNVAFKDYDYLIGPTSPSTAFKIGEAVKDPLQMYLTDIMTVAANLTGVPAISIPAGEVEGLPLGLQLMSRRKNDRALLSAAKYTEELLNK